MSRSTVVLFCCIAAAVVGFGAADSGSDGATGLNSLLCGRNEVQNCVYSCPPEQTCETRDKQFFCPDVITPCKNKCVCKPGYYRNAIGDCITEKQCKKCSKPNEFFACGDVCDNVCSTLDKQNRTNCPFISLRICTEKCYCKDGYARDANNNCVPVDQCAQPACGPRERLVDCPGDCAADKCPESEEEAKNSPIFCEQPTTCPPPACKCAFNNRRAKNGTCIPTRECPAFPCSGKNEVYNPCPPICPTDDCSQATPSGKCPALGNIGIVLFCVPACRCREGYWRNDGVCIPYAECHVLLCYYGTWATKRPGLGKFDVDNVDTTLCTHIVYAFAGINEQGELIALDPQLDLADNGGKDNYRKFTGLKKKNPKLKTMLAVGGWGEGSAKYSKMAGNATLRANFMRTTIKVLVDCGFDGLDMDWEYPTARDSVNGQADVVNFTTLLKELKDSFTQYNFILTAAVAAVKASASVFYDVTGISKYLDFINVMAYDLHGPWESETGYNAALFRTESEAGKPLDTLLTGEAALGFWIGAGAPRNKLLFGMPLYGHTYKLKDARKHSVGSPSSGSGFASPYTAQAGTIGYNELCVDLRNRTAGWTVVYDNHTQVPYAYRGQDWVSYDNVRSLVAKANYAKKLKLAGAMVWSIETDDFHALCSNKPFPLLRALNCALGRKLPY